MMTVQFNRQIHYNKYYIYMSCGNTVDFSVLVGV